MIRENEGIFITFEGIEGAGKSTQIDLLADYLERKGYDVVVTREPGGTGIGESTREILLNPDFHGMDFLTELFLYAASRAQLVSEIIRPALAAGKTVLCDRFADSSLAYQGFGRGLPLDRIEALNEWATQGCSPQLTIILSVPAQHGLERATRTFTDRIEKEAVDFHQRVKCGYEKLVGKYPDRIHLVDALGGPDEIKRRIIGIVEEFLERGKQR